MAAVCPLEGCKSHRGLCIHDKMMMVMAVLMMGGAVAHWGLHLI